MSLFNTFVKIVVLSLITVFCLPVMSQTYWGHSNSGGTFDKGTIYTVTEAGVFTKKHDFSRILGGTPKSDLIKATNGLYYGVTEADGTNGGGVLFSYNPVSGEYIVRVNFTVATATPTGIGSMPVKGLVQAGNGLLYGLCQFGGANNKGTLYSFDPVSNVVVRITSFAGANGDRPYSKLILGSTTDTMWGTTQLGGTNNSGTIFQYTVGGTLTVRFSFGAAAANTTGRLPRTNLTKATNGRLFGVANTGGANNLGTVFEIGTSAPFTFTLIRALTTTDGGTPIGGLVEGATNVLYGTTSTNGSSGSGTIFSVNATAATPVFTKVKDLVGTTAAGISASMTKGADGLLYGTSTSGGISGQGCIFTYNITSTALTSLASFSTADLSGTWTAMVQDGAVWYGLSSAGGGGTGGAIFRFTPATNTISPLVAFSSSNGANPSGRMLMASNGKFYGLTTTGGSFGLGVLFSIDPVNSAFTRVVDLGSATGIYPLNTLLEVGGKIYGLCNDGGSNDAGTIFEYDLSTNVFLKKLDLTVANGSKPLSGFMQASNGSLYTTMSEGGANGLGTIVRYVPGTNTLTKIHDFNTTTGSAPESGLFQASNGLLYGVTVEGGAVDAGTLYSLNTTTNAVNKLYDFDMLQGGSPAGDLMQAGNGRLYGTCRDDGLFMNGCIFSWNISTSTYVEEYDMMMTEGRYSESNLVQGVDGKLYGTCVQGGTNEEGTVFRFDPVASTFSVLQSLATLTSGKYPKDGLVKEVLPVAGTDLLLNAKLFLEGPFVTADGKMTDGLRTLVGANGFPLTEPFTGLGFTQAGGGGGETISASVLTATGDNAIVDWVLVELRNKNNSSSIVRTRAALLQRDGDVVGLNGTSVVSINAPADNYFVALRSRNHFGVMTSTASALNSSTALALNFTNGSVATFGTNAQKTVGAVRLCWAGNARRDNQLKYTGSNNDRDPILVRLGGTVPTATAAGYFIEDVNMNGSVKYTGSGNDRDPILVNVGGTVPTATRAEQLP